MTVCYNVKQWVYSLYNSVNFLSPQITQHTSLISKPLATKWVHKCVCVRVSVCVCVCVCVFLCVWWVVVCVSPLPLPSLSPALAGSFLFPLPSLSSSLYSSLSLCPPPSPPFLVPSFIFLFLTRSLIGRTPVHSNGYIVAIANNTLCQNYRFCAKNH